VFHYTKKGYVCNDSQQWPPTLLKEAITSQLHSLNTIKTTTYEVRNQGTGLGQAHLFGGEKQVNGTPTRCLIVYFGIVYIKFLLCENNQIS
jgi:hypothetical protein